LKGTTSENGEDSDIMLNAKINIFPDSYCQNRDFNELGLVDGKYQLCAGTIDGMLNNFELSLKPNLNIIKLL
jgi:hypothetical protein